MARCQDKGWIRRLKYLAPPSDQKWVNLMTPIKTIYYHGVEDFVNHERNILSVTLQIAFFIAYSFKVYAWIQELVWTNHCYTTSRPHLHKYPCNLVLVLQYFLESNNFRTYIKFRDSSEARSTWPSTHPTLLSEAFFAVATVVSFLRFFSFYTINRTLGPLQISFSYSLGFCSH